VKIKIKTLRPAAILPQYQTGGAAAFDFHAAIDQPLTVAAGRTATVPTGLAVEIPDGYELQVRARSGLSFKNGISLINGVGTIDADFRDEMMIGLINLSSKDFVVEPGMRIAQGVVARVERVEWSKADELSTTNRRGGFGSTGR
jgi:dUTP pyrophosphatase